ncbi:hypothetical protein [Sporosarcina sp. OR05]|uniref:hypothetical protein n=1 Tax=Sporosarcina sp. OR05 TaxID=2969819 RepID=UPI00352AD2E9
MGLLLTIIMSFSIILLFISLFYAVINRSWSAMFVCFIASLPVSLYFASVSSPLSYLGLAPVLFLILMIGYRVKFRSNEFNN